MNVTEGILLNNNINEIKFKNEKTVKVVSYNNSEDELSDIKVKTINVKEYDVIK